MSRREIDWDCLPIPDQVVSAQAALDALLPDEDHSQEEPIYIQDLLSNLMHLCDAKEDDFEYLLECARRNYEYECDHAPKVRRTR